MLTRLKITLRLVGYLLLLCPAQMVTAQFVLNGAATQINDTCFQLTTATNWQNGSIWNEEKINLNESFSMTINALFGCKDENGADGLVFAFQPLNTSQGSQGAGIGFESIMPSIGIEFDTWQNFDFNDPFFDHIAIIQNGGLSHATQNNLLGPFQASSSSPNIEDCEYHQLRVNWDAFNQILEVYFDCELRMTYTKDIVDDIFNGDPEVFWGFTSATGGANNRHEVCLTEIKFVEPAEDVVICPGGQYQLQVTGGDTYRWTPTTGLSNPNIPNPIAAPAESTTYIVEILNDNCVIPQFDTIDVFVDGDTVFFDLGIDTTLCEGSNYTLDASSNSIFSVDYIWNTGSTQSTIIPDATGNYGVTVTIDDYCIAEERVNINIIPFPEGTPPVDTSLCLEQSFFVDVTNPNTDSYRWQDGEESPIRTIISAGIYTVERFNFCGSITETFNITFEDCTNVFAPNVFSPNGDGFNEIFIIMDEGDVDIVSSFKIFNRWGGLVFEAENFKPNDLKFGWDGRINGENADIGVYTWMAALLFRNGDEALMRGDVMLMR